MTSMRDDDHDLADALEELRRAEARVEPPQHVEAAVLAAWDNAHALGTTRRPRSLWREAAGPSPRLVTIVDPVAGQSYTLDDKQRVAYRNPVAMTKLRTANARGWVAATDTHVMTWTGPTSGTAAAGKPSLAISAGQRVIAGESAATRVTTESLGTKSIEGVMAEGTRTTSTIPAGAIGNLMPIEVVSERWYSKELQMPVLISRRDPRTGDSVHRLRNIVEAEPPQDLFSVPPDYQIRSGALGEFSVGEFKILKKADEDKK